jgi:protein-L-isoaspartate(D-aspartate) O-methyltransferase
MISNSEIARNQMVNQQVRCWDVLDPRVLQVLAQVPREDFVPAAFRGLAFADTAIPLGGGTAMLTPQLEGRLLQALALNPADRVLEIGTGTGFLTACLARLAGHVTSIEIDPERHAAAAGRLGQLGIDNVELLLGNGFELESRSGYDAIALGGSLPEYDPRFESWLRLNGRLFVVAGEAPLMHAWLALRTGAEEWSRERLFETLIAPLTGLPRRQRFVF